MSDYLWVRPAEVGVAYGLPQFVIQWDVSHMTRKEAERFATWLEDVYEALQTRLHNLEAYQARKWRRRIQHLFKHGTVVCKHLTTAPSTQRRPTPA